MHFRELRICTVIIYFAIFFTKGFSQNQKTADSLITVYETHVSNQNNLSLIFKIINETINADTKLKFSNLLIEKAPKDSLILQYSGYLQKANALSEKADFPEALECYFSSLKYAEKTKTDAFIGAALIGIADTYSNVDNPHNAQKYYLEGIEKLRLTKDSLKLGNALYNVGDNYLKTGNTNDALSYTNKAGSIFKNLKDIRAMAYVDGNLGRAYAEKEKYELALEKIKSAIETLEKLEDYYPIPEFLIYMSDIYVKKGDIKKALTYANKSLNLAKKYHLDDQLSETYLKLSNLYEAQGNFKDSHFNYKQHILYRDSIANLKNIQKMSALRTNYEVSKKEAEVNILQKEAEISQLKDRRQKAAIYATAAIIFLISLLAWGLYRRYKFINKTKIIIENEKKRSDDLLKNILPEKTAEELKQHGKVKAQKIKNATVLFTDFVGFTKYSEHLPPQQLVESIDYYFSKFDEIISRYQLEKIKTVGDAYMCASGLHNHSQDHTNNMILAAMDIIHFVNHTKSSNTELSSNFDIRIGINTGPVVAGVVGTKKFAYDIWGDTVNVASRMESCSLPGKINISHNTYKIVKNEFECEYRGKVEVKNRGIMKMYFVNSKNNSSLTIDS
ncbi:adenylate/guanylate cyclase domain-containing protein [Mangrovimonas sp. YM274]|uniref:adenylate/guanylate cyclase domain-containing protein n=1 Tax=Mangrovimonas sp. YM274 TaxID=3070660 RepID=UPI0027DD12C5|nr:adenylate/guanylate cyclase domain-containing protein [Mangrovimonas sp. YM274]WMI70212.1 adenylate/guanylate cyclase domain-containing protein [Mangrovimonas sp. YM274]